MKTIAPKDVYRSEFPNSPFRDRLMELFLSCIAITQWRRDPDRWTPFTWEEYVSRCDHQPTDAERNLLEAMVTGGTVTLTDMRAPNTITLQKGYLLKEGERYSVAEPLLRVLAPYAAMAG